MRRSFSQRAARQEDLAAAELALQPEGRRPMTAADYLHGQASAGHGKLKLG